MPTKNELIMLQSLPLDIKILKTQARIRDAITLFGEDCCYISFSGGKDSTVLLHIAREMYPNITVVFVDTGLEYPEVKDFVNKHDNIKTIRPLITFKKTIIKYGYPFISKEIAQTISEARKHIITNKYSYRMDKLNGTCIDKNTGNLSKYNCPKYKPLLYTNFLISDKCCNIMKKKPLKDNMHSKIAIIGTMASESALRTTQWLKNGCNAFDGNKKISMPMGFWTNKDVLEYIVTHKIKIASVYGNILESNTKGQFTLPGFGTCLKCTGVQRTGCIFCGFGAHLDTRKNGKCRYDLL